MSDDVDDHEPDDRRRHGCDDDSTCRLGSGAGRDRDRQPRLPGRPRSKRRAALAERRRRRRRVWAAFAVVAVLVLPFVVFAGWFWSESHPPGDAGDAVSLDVQQGWGTSECRRRAAGPAASSVRRSPSRSGARVHGGGTVPGRDLRPPHQPRRPVPHAARSSAAWRGVEPSRRAPTRSDARADRGDRVGQVPAPRPRSFLAAADSGAVRSKYEPPGVSSLEGLTYPDTYFVGEHETDDRRSCAGSSPASTSKPTRPASARRRRPGCRPTRR